MALDDNIWFRQFDATDGKPAAHEYHFTHGDLRCLSLNDDGVLTITVESKNSTPLKKRLIDALSLSSHYPMEQTGGTVICRISGTKRYGLIEAIKLLSPTEGGKDVFHCFIDECNTRDQLVEHEKAFLKSKQKLIIAKTTGRPAADEGREL